MADHIAIDGGMVRRWQGEDIDLSIPLTSDIPYTLDGDFLNRAGGLIRAS